MKRAEKIKEIISTLIDVGSNEKGNDSLSSYIDFHYQNRQNHSIIFIKDIGEKQIKTIIKKCDDLKIRYKINVEGFVIIIDELNEKKK